MLRSSTKATLTLAMAASAAGTVTIGREARMNRRVSFTISHHSRRTISANSTRPCFFAASLGMPGPSFVHMSRNHRMVFLRFDASMVDRAFVIFVEKLHLAGVGDQPDFAADPRPEPRRQTGDQVATARRDIEMNLRSHRFREIRDRGKGRKMLLRNMRGVQLVDVFRADAHPCFAPFIGRDPRLVVVRWERK